MAYFIFNARDFSPFSETLSSLGYIGYFICGIAYSYGFTAGPSTALLLILSKEQNIIIGGLIGGVGALIGDILIFKLVRHSLEDEVERLAGNTTIQSINGRMPYLLKKYLFSLMAIIVIASPLPDEIGVSMFAAFTRIKTGSFFLISFFLNTLGIISVLTIGNLI